MDFYVDMAVAVFLRLLKDRRGIKPYYGAIAKVYVKILQLAEVDSELQKAIHERLSDT